MVAGMRVAVLPGGTGRALSEAEPVRTVAISRRSSAASNTGSSSLTTRTYERVGTLFPA